MLEADFAHINRQEADEPFLVDLDGFEGPLDLLLELARQQKVDLHKISILALAEQYLAFIEAVRRVRLELAADYLVMAAWLAWLKSRMLLPDPPRPEGPSAAELADDLARRLQKLDQIRLAGQALLHRPRLGQDFFARGAPEGFEGPRGPVWQAELYDLLTAYARQREIHALSHVTVRQRIVWSLAQAREALERFLGTAVEWAVLSEYLEQYCPSPELGRTVTASAFSAMLEMVHEGALDVRQDAAFAPLHLRANTSEQPKTRRQDTALRRVAKTAKPVPQSF